MRGGVVGGGDEVSVEGGLGFQLGQAGEHGHGVAAVLGANRIKANLNKHNLYNSLLLFLFIIIKVTIHIHIRNVRHKKNYLRKRKKVKYFWNFRNFFFLKYLPIYKIAMDLL